MIIPEQPAGDPAGCSVKHCLSIERFLGGIMYGVYMKKFVVISFDNDRIMHIT